MDEPNLRRFAHPAGFEVVFAEVLEGVVLIDTYPAPVRDTGLGPFASPPADSFLFSAHRSTLGFLVQRDHTQTSQRNAVLGYDHECVVDDGRVD